MAEYIERDKVLYDIDEAMKFRGLGFLFGSELKRYITRQPSADVVEVKHGRWVGLEYDGFADGCPVYDLWECSECGEEVSGEDVPDTHPYCPNCGCRMDKDGE